MNGFRGTTGNWPTKNIFIAEMMWSLPAPVVAHINALHDFATARATENERLRAEIAELRAQPAPGRAA